MLSKHLSYTATFTTLAWIIAAVTIHMYTQGLEVSFKLQYHKIICLIKEIGHIENEEPKRCNIIRDFSKFCKNISTPFYSYPYTYMQDCKLSAQ